MTSLIKLLLPLVVLFAFTTCTAQIPNAKTTTAHIYGNCGMCEKTIEKAAYKKGEAKADWDKDTKIAQITYDSSLTSADVILQRIAAAGYDSDQFKAADEAYNNLAGCCQYDRPKTAEASASPSMAPAADNSATPAPEMVKKYAVVVAAVNSAGPLAEVYAAYFALKNALVATDGNTAAAQAKLLFKAIDNVQMEAFTATQHPVWMKYQQKLSYDAEHIKGVTDTDHQREHFASLSKNMYEIMKVIKPETAIYYDHCPMYNGGKGGDWLSMEQTIKNPYYGRQMLTCGSVTETLQ